MDLDGVITRHGVPFVTSAGNTLMHPLDPTADLSEICNCRCVSNPIYGGRAETMGDKDD